MDRKIRKSMFYATRTLLSQIKIYLRDSSLPYSDVFLLAKNKDFFSVEHPVGISEKTNRFKAVRIPERIFRKVVKDDGLKIIDDSAKLFFPYTKENTKNKRFLQKHTVLVYPLLSQREKIGAITYLRLKAKGEVTKEEKVTLSLISQNVNLHLEKDLLSNNVFEITYQMGKLKKRLEFLEEDKDEFIQMVAHELRAPLSAIKGFISMVVQGDTGDIPEKTRGYLVDANAINERIIRLVNNMLNVTRLEEGRLMYQMEDENLSHFVRVVFSQFAPEAQRKGLEYVLEIHQEVRDKVYVDPERIQEVISNLLSNAMKYTDKGFVKVRLIQPKKSTVRFEVEDSGPGISEEEQKKLFQKFRRIETNVGKTTGTGLGLYISKLLVEKFKGKIGIISELGKGSTFWFELPLKP